jgi:DNA uptake protein ComE-like DNA-binding protein
MPSRHQNSMHPLTFRSIRLLACALLLANFTACTDNNNKDNPDEIRQRAADATATVARDTKAVVEGVKEGINRDKTVNINKASREDLLSLPGVTEHEADRIIAGRPFADAHDLVKRHVLPEAEYARISDRISADQ